jgi:2-polyprenyl-3-methyl-5-hydroxy-6-metoxy-1,4-benzoquinol methylase
VPFLAMIKILSKFKYRSTREEILDQPGISQTLLKKNFAEMDFINRWLGGTALTLKGLNSLLKDKEKHYSILDIGCGSGKMLVELSKWLKRKGIKASLTGIDINSEAIKIAQKKKHSEINFQYGSYTNVNDSFDVIISSLFCHHLSDKEFTNFLQFSKEKSKLGFIINDLNRHPIPYYIIWFLSRAFNGTKLLRNDAPLSVLRGFKRVELLKNLQQAGIKNVSIQRNWAFRYLITSKTTDEQQI